MRYFTLKEFDSPDMPGSGELMSAQFIQLLDKARHRAKTSFIISSGYRTREHNKKVGGVSNSSHTKGLAVDIKCINSSERFSIINALLDIGFHRIGVNKTFIHVDNDTNKNGFVLWMYK